MTNQELERSRRAELNALDTQLPRDSSGDLRSIAVFFDISGIIIMLETVSARSMYVLNMLNSNGI